MTLPVQKVSEIINKHSELEKDLSSSNLDSSLFAQKSKEYSSLNEIIKYALEYSSFDKNKKDLEKIISEIDGDEEMRELAKLELDELIKKHKDNEIKLKLYLLHKDEPSNLLCGVCEIEFLETLRFSFSIPIFPKEIVSFN